jgi:hypothetical protein
LVHVAVRHQLLQEFVEIGKGHVLLHLSSTS